MLDAAAGTNNLGQALKGAKRPMIIVGNGIFDREDGAEVHAAVRQLCDVRLAKNDKI